MKSLPQHQRDDRRAPDAAVARRSHQVDPRNHGHMQATRVFGLAPHIHYSDEKPQVVEARYVGNIVETVIQKVIRSEFKSLIIFVLVLFGALITAFLVAFIAGVL